MPTEELPGNPRNKLIREVRRDLWRHMRCRPQQLDEAWIAAWEWARQCRDVRFGTGRWPASNEIATQFIVLAMVRMKTWRALRLPFAAREQGVHRPLLESELPRVPLLTQDHIADVGK